MAALAEVPRTVDGFSSFGEQLLAVRRAAESGGYDTDPRLLEIQRRATIAPAGASEMVPSDGGFLIAPEFAQDLLRRVYNTGKILEQCTKFAITKGNTFSWRQFAEVSRQTGSRLGGIQVYRQNEASSIQVISSGTYSQKPTVALQTITCNKYTGLLYLTDELSMDTSAFGTWAAYAYAEEMAFCLELDAVNGTGAGELLGVLNSPTLVTVPKQIGQASGTVVAQNIIDMVGSHWAASRPRASWIYNQNLLPSLMSLTVTVGSGGSALPLWHFSEDPSQPDTLCGIPCAPSEYCAAPGTPGDIILADWSRFAIGTREVRADSSIHVLYVSDQNTFKFVTRIGGMPIDYAPIVPLFGATATSTFVALAQR